MKKALRVYQGRFMIVINRELEGCSGAGREVIQAKMAGGRGGLETRDLGDPAPLPMDQLLGWSWAHRRTQYLSSCGS